ncbi:Protein RDR1 [Cyphellophora attinorum]|uniref:Protein RDR1 n=1 Tax=Cyphellophora attinorum TaxID=1664694 RepID=A0A0N0NSA6_9EURO|nr:Protein RDR1 [Phialophora attinorum]KPI46031.1 Protein RDR1 [Phialophora attinorum]
MCTRYEYDCTYDTKKGDTAAALDPSKAASSSAAKRIMVDHSQSTYATDYDSATKRPVIHTPPSTAASESHGGRGYAGSCAATTFPHVLGIALGSSEYTDILTTSSFAFNFGNRPEESSKNRPDLGTLISQAFLAQYSEVFFSSLATVIDLIDPAVYTRRCRHYYDHDRYSGTAIAFSAVAAGVCAIGSFLSPNRCERESDLVQYAKTILDDTSSIRLPDVDHVIGWGFRMLYLRATSRPNNAWLASCTLMHLCEAVGLNDENAIQRITSAPDAALLGHTVNQLRRVFWIAWAGHSLLSYEYDRSPVIFGTLKMGIPEEAVESAIAFGKAATEAAVQLAAQGCLFWNVISSVFQYACVLLAIDSPVASEHIPGVFAALEQVANSANTRLMRETLSIARHLLGLRLAKKRKELAQLEGIGSAQSYEHQPDQLGPTSHGTASTTDINAAEFDFDLDWDQFTIEPFLSMFGPDSGL